MDASKIGERIDSKTSGPASLGFSIDFMDRSVDPAENFYLFAAGNWIKTNPIPADKSSWGSFGELRERNMSLLRQLLEKCSKDPDPGNEKQRQIGHFYHSAMNTQAIESRKLAPIKGELEAIKRISSVSDLMAQITAFHRKGIPALFSAFSDGDKKNSSIYALYLWQGGTSLPSKEYYLSEQFSEVRQQYLEHIEKMFTLSGRGGKEAKKFATLVLEIETALAKASRFPAELRDDEKNYNRVAVSSLSEKYESLELNSYLSSLSVSPVDYVIVGQPEFYDAIEKALKERSLDDWKVYLEWNLLRSSAPFLHEAFEMESFDFFRRKLMGQQEPEDRWKRAVTVIDGSLGESLGELYVKKYFGTEAEQKMSLLVDDIKDVFKDRLSKLSWMSEDTRIKALEKFERFHTKIGHPVVYRDYSSIKVDENDYIGNVLRASEFEVKRQAERVGKPIDRNEWQMTPPTVNAYFSPTDNEIVFPAGILQPPYFDVSMDDAVNYGGIGGVISHEITHGYDDQGRHYDLEGNLKDWWKPEDEEQFLKRSKAVVDLYGSLEVLPGVKVNGNLTLGENIADFGGVSIAYEALQRRLNKNPELRKNIDGLTPEQRFFLSWAQIWRQNVREQEAKRRITIDPHAPDKFRGLVPVLNHPEFEKTFDLKSPKTLPCKPTEKIAIW